MALFQPGNNMNPAGRPKGSLSFKTVMVQRLRAGGKQEVIAIVDAMIRDAIDGPVEARNKARELLIDRIDGKLIAEATNSLTINGPVQFVFPQPVFEAI